MEYMIIIVLGALILMAWLVFGGEGDTEVPTNPPQPVPDFESMTKAELLEYAEENGIEVKKSWSKQRILLTIQDPDLFNTN
jgi:hypothetical protein